MKSDNRETNQGEVPKKQAEIDSSLAKTMLHIAISCLLGWFVCLHLSLRATFFIYLSGVFFLAFFIMTIAALVLFVLQKKQCLKKDTPKGELKFCLVVLFFVVCWGLSWFLLGYSPDVSAFWESIAFIAFPLVFFASVITVLASLILLVIRLKGHWKVYSIPEKVLRITILLGILYLISCFESIAGDLTLLGLHLKVEKTGGVEQLQNWAVGILETPLESVIEKENYGRDGTGQIKTELLSEQLKQINGNYVVLVREENRKPYLHILCGGGGFLEVGWGINVGEPGFSPEEDERSFKSYHWHDGVYGFYIY